MLLNCHTCYSLCYGTYAPRDLMAAVQYHGYTAFALTDINNTSACLDSLRIAHEYHLHVVPGIDFRNRIKSMYVGLARNNNGFRVLNEHLSMHLHKQQSFAASPPLLPDTYIIYPISTYTGHALRDNERLGLGFHDLRSLSLSPYKHLLAKMVWMQSVSFAGKRQFNAHRLLRAIDNNMLLSKLPAEEQASGDDRIMHRESLEILLAAYPQLIQQSDELLANCDVSFTYGKLSNKNLHHYTGSMAGDMDCLRQQCMEGLSYRYPVPGPVVWERLEKELEVIGQLGFASYYLINWDIIRYAQSKQYYYVGRGSGANSLVAYLLRITDVDPIDLDLYFERFINLYRNNAPDFDIDFSWTDRDDITRYIFTRFGVERTALLGAYNTFQRDAVIRELGKVFGLPPGEIDQLQRVAPDKIPDQLSRLVLQYSNLIQGLPSHLSIHASGILISELPISTYSATFLPPKGYPTTQFSMLEAEDIGLYKFDILSQRGLGKIRDCLNLVEENQGVSLDIHDMNRFKADPRVKQMLRQGKTMGCFYVESPAMRMLLTKLQADDYLRLVAASSIIRPGVARSGMMREYIVRYRDESLRRQAQERLPELYAILEETYGVMVYQEDVIRVAHLFAGLSLAEADYLRRGMSWKFKQRGEFAQVKDRFFENCRQKGYPESLSAEIWNQIESFANFAFSKGHSASYAVESYQAMFLKAHYPLEYMTATLNNGGGFYRPEFYIHEARMHGAVICPPCVNQSTAHAVIRQQTIYLGFQMIGGLEQESIRLLLEERNRGGDFLNLLDFTQRVPLTLEQLRLLIRSGGFSFTGRSKKELLWEVHSLLQPNSRPHQLPTLFQPEIRTWVLPKLEHADLEEAFDQIDLLGFPLCSSFRLLRDQIPAQLRAADLGKYLNQDVSICGQLVTVKYAHTIKGERMFFGTFLDLEGHWIDTVHFPPSAKAWPFTGPGCYEIHGRVVEEYDFISLEVNCLRRLPMVDRDAVLEGRVVQRLSM